MANTYSQIYIQIVFAVKGRENILHKSWRDEVFKYISAIIAHKGQKAIIVNGVGDHVHVFVGVKPTIPLSDLVREIKNNSSKFINAKGWIKGKFEWQEGYGAFSYSHSQLDSVYKYILNQESHHEKKTFKEEYHDFLEKFNVDFNDKFLFEWII
jgi:REP element-mobilizing transposase RayT